MRTSEIEPAFLTCAGPFLAAAVQRPSESVEAKSCTLFI